MEQVRGFRRLCVRYGEARAKYGNEEAPRSYREEWRKECDYLWGRIQLFEKGAALLTGAAEAAL